MRLPSFSKYKILKKNNVNDWNVEIYRSRCAKSRSKKYLYEKEITNLPKKITLRVIKTHRKGFRPRYILTSLLDDILYSYKDICELYGDRWVIENYYRDLKHIFKIEQFHAKYVDSVYQEIYASLVLMIILQQYIVKAHVKFNVLALKKLFIYFLNVFYYLIYTLNLVLKK